MSVNPFLIKFLNSLVLVLGIFIFNSCESSIEREKIVQGSTHKLRFTGIVNTDNLLSFQWEVKKQPEDNELYLLVDGYRALFTPDATGEYDIVVWVINLVGEKIDSQEFRFLVQENPRYTKVAIKNSITHESNSDKEKSELSSEPVIDENDSLTIDNKHADIDTIDNPSTPEINGLIGITSLAHSQYVQMTEMDIEKGFTIQIAALQSLEDARSQFDELENLNLPVYLQEFVDENNSWYRVRLGFYSSKSECEALLQSNSLSQNNITGWITAIEIK